MLKIGVIGLGKMGKLHFMNALHTKDVKVVAVADKIRRNLEKAKNHHVNVYLDYKKLIDSENLDAVIISLPNFLRMESIIYASERNVDIFVDKPLARNLEEAKSIVKKVRSQDVRLMVGVNYRYIDSVKRLKEGFDEGKIGDAVIATSELIMNGPFSHPLVPTRVPEWWLTKELSGGGTLLDLGYHLIDIFHWMFGDFDILYSTLGYRFDLPLEDSATLILKSRKTSTRGVINVGWFSKMIFPKFNFRINLHGTVGYKSTDSLAPKNLYLNSAKEAVLNFMRYVGGKEIHRLSYTYYYSTFAKILDLFFDSIKKDSEVPISLEGQLGVVEAIESIYKQHGVRQ